jgi:Carboxypeptidase regulatory-like domain
VDAIPRVAVLGLVLALAGCTEAAEPGPTTDQAFSGLDLTPTSSTGIIRGVVVDEAIRPLAGVRVELTGPQTASTTSTADGLFGFEGLAPGDYFLAASRDGYQAVQQGATVVAGVADPPIVRLLMPADPTTAPFVTLHRFDGFIECSFSLVAAGFSACSTGPLASTFNDAFSVSYEVEEVPDWVQSETVWESAQPVSPALTLLWTMNGQDALLANWGEVEGASPLVLMADRTRIDEVGLGSTLDCPTEAGPGCLYIRVFNAPIEGTNQGCIPRPALGGCTTGAGATVEQTFTTFSNLFYRFTPQPGWLFITDGAHVVPT